MTLSLNFVGFAMDDPELAAQFEDWAIASGEQLDAAKNPHGFNDAVTSELATSSTDYNTYGKALVSGIVNGKRLDLVWECIE